MKKICIIRHGHYPFDIRVRKEALALVKKGYHVDIICLRQGVEKRREVNHGVNIYRIPIKHRREGISRYIYEYTSFFFWQRLSCGHFISATNMILFKSILCRIFLYLLR